jgi:hypothetical protein
MVKLECELVKAIEVLRRNLPQYHFVYHKSLKACPGIERGPAVKFLCRDTAFSFEIILSLLFRTY